MATYGQAPYFNQRMLATYPMDGAESGVITAKNVAALAQVFGEPTVQFNAEDDKPVTMNQMAEILGGDAPTLTRIYHRHLETADGWEFALCPTELMTFRSISEVIRIPQFVMELAPEDAPPSLIRRYTERTQVQMRRWNLGFKERNDVLMRPEGAEIFRENMAALTSSAYTRAKLIIAAHAATRQNYYRFRGRMNERYRDIQDATADQRQFFGCASTSDKWLYDVKAFVDAVMGTENVVPDMGVGPDGWLNRAAKAEYELEAFRRGESVTKDRLINSGFSIKNMFAGSDSHSKMRFYEAKKWNIANYQQENVELFLRDVLVSQWWLQNGADPKHGQDDYLVHKELAVCVPLEDGWTEISPTDLENNNMRWAQDGSLDPRHADLVTDVDGLQRKSGFTVKAGLLDPFCYLGTGNKYDIIQMWGEADLRYWSVDSLRQTARRVVLQVNRDQTAADVTAVQAVRNMERDVPDNVTAYAQALIDVLVPKDANGAYMNGAMGTAREFVAGLFVAGRLQVQRRQEAALAPAGAQARPLAQALVGKSRFSVQSAELLAQHAEVSSANIRATYETPEAAERLRAKFAQRGSSGLAITRDLENSTFLTEQARAAVRQNPRQSLDAVLDSIHQQVKDQHQQRKVVHQVLTRAKTGHGAPLAQEHLQQWAAESSPLDKAAAEARVTWVDTDQYMNPAEFEKQPAEFRAQHRLAGGFRPTRDNAGVFDRTQPTVESAQAQYAAYATNADRGQSISPHFIKRMAALEAEPLPIRMAATLLCTNLVHKKVVTHLLERNVQPPFSSHLLVQRGVRLRMGSMFFAKSGSGRFGVAGSNVVKQLDGATKQWLVHATAYMGAHLPDPRQFMWVHDIFFRELLGGCDASFFSNQAQLERLATLQPGERDTLPSLFAFNMGGNVKERDVARPFQLCGKRNKVMNQYQFRDPEQVFDTHRNNGPPMYYQYIGRFYERAFQGAVDYSSFSSERNSTGVNDSSYRGSQRLWNAKTNAFDVPIKGNSHLSNIDGEKLAGVLNGTDTCYKGLQIDARIVQ